MVAKKRTKRSPNIIVTWKVTILLKFFWALPKYIGFSLDL